MSSLLWCRAGPGRIPGAIGLSASQALARAAGSPYDAQRIELFDALFAALHREPFAAIADPAPRGQACENFAFYEAYFSNFIEGTTFTLDEAADIVFDRAIPDRRPQGVEPVSKAQTRRRPATRR